MAYDENFIIDLEEITELIKEKKINGEDEALSKFEKYLISIQSIGKFSVETWNRNWRTKIWDFGTLFKNQDPIQFLQIIEVKLESIDIINKEVLEFLRSEIIVTFLPDKECKSQLEKLIKVYSYNPEFRHTLGHYYLSEKEYILAIEEYKLASKIEPTNNYYLKNRFNTEWQYLNLTIKNGEYQIGKDYVNLIFAENFYQKKHTTYYNTFVDLYQRFEDHILFQEKLFSLEIEFKEKMKSELENERKSVIEILGFFSAIMAFILSTVSIGKNYSFQEAIYFIIALGVILILFVSALSTLFATTERKIYKDKNFWILLIGLLTLFVLLLNIEKVADLTKSRNEIDKIPVKKEKNIR